MYDYIVEDKEKLKTIIRGNDCFVEFIQGNDHVHPALNYAVGMYYKEGAKSYLVVLKHPESITDIELEEVSDRLKESKIYCRNAKETSYYLQEHNLIDLNLTAIDCYEQLKVLTDTTPAHDYYNRNFENYKRINELIPVCKHYEKLENIYNKVKDLIGLEYNQGFNSRYVKVYKNVEKTGIGINSEIFNEFYKTRLFTEDKVIYGYYNLYNLTARPTNAYNGVNFLAINKDDFSRKSFIPRNNYFVEFDMAGYHLDLIAKLVGYKINTDESLHEHLGKLYFNKDRLTQEEYQQSKNITFKQLYGGVSDKYKHLEYYKKVQTYIEDVWEMYVRDQKIKLPTGRIIKGTSLDLTPAKLFNYILQNLETYSNVLILEKLEPILKSKKTKIILSVYDSFLFDFSFSDGKNLIEEIKKVIENQGFKVKIKAGKDYYSLKDLDYL